MSRFDPMRYWPAGAALAVLAALLGVYAWRLLAQSGGIWVYPLDDTYIHMAMAKNLARHLVFGVSPFEFTSSSSSPAWVALLAAVFVITGAWPLAPLLLNLLAAIGLIALADRWWRRHGLPPGARLAASLALLAALPLAPMVATGMEHVLHVLVSLALMMLAGARLVRPNRSGGRLVFLALCAVSPMLRYESLFLIASIAGLLLLRRCWRDAAMAAVAALAGVLLYGSIAQLQGWPPLPFSIYLKSGLHEAATKGTLVPANFMFTLTLGTAHRLLIAFWPWTLMAVLGLALIGWQWREQRRFWTLPIVSALMVMPVAWLHAALVRHDDAGRYDAHVVSLLLLGIVPIAWLQTRHLFVNAHKLAAVVLALWLIVPVAALAKRLARLETFSLPWAQSVQQTSLFVAQFAADYRPGGKIVTMELGGLAWSGDFHIVDLLGLGSGEVARLFWQRRDNLRTVGALAAGFDLAIVFDDWYVTIYGAGKPPWAKIARITSANGLGGGIDLYAGDNARAQVAREALKSFAARLGFAGTLTFAE